MSYCRYYSLVGLVKKVYPWYDAYKLVLYDSKHDNIKTKLAYLKLKDKKRKGKRRKIYVSDFGSMIDDLVRTCNVRKVISVNVVFKETKNVFGVPYFSDFNHYSDKFKCCDFKKLHMVAPDYDEIIYLHHGFSKDLDKENVEIEGYKKHKKPSRGVLKFCYTKILKL